MYGKAQREPAARSLINANQALGSCVDVHRRHLVNMIKAKGVANVSLQLLLRANVRRWAKTRQLFSACRLCTEVHRMFLGGM